jgi:hypothetical protein
VSSRSKEAVDFPVLLARQARRVEALACVHEDKQTAPVENRHPEMTAPMDDLPVRSVSLVVKQLDPSALNEFGLGVVRQCFGGFMTPRTEDDPDVVEQHRALDSVGLGLKFDPTQARRFAGDHTLHRGRYYTVCRSESGDDGGTLMNELRAYYDPFSAGLVDIFDTTVPSSKERLPSFVAAELSRRAAARRPGHLVFVIRPLGGKPFPMQLPPFAVALPLSILNIVIERAMDLRDPHCARWLTKALSRLTWTVDGKQVPAFLAKPPISSFKELLPSLYMQALGGGAGANQIAGLWLREVGVDGVIFPSARTDTYVMVNDGAVQGSSGWNFVDYRGAGPPMYGGQFDTIPCWPTWIAAEPRDVSPLDKPIIFASAELESIEEGPAAGSWRVTGLENTRAALVHMGEALFCLGTKLNLREDPRIPYVQKLMMQGHFPAPEISMPPWEAADIFTRRGIEWQTTFCTAIKDIFFGRSIFGNFGSLVFGYERSRAILDTWINAVTINAGGQRPHEIEVLKSVLSEIANGYRRPYGPSVFKDADKLS